MFRGMNLRQRQISDILNEDRNINKQVFAKEFQQAKIFTEDIKPITPVEESVKLNINAGIDKFIKEIDDVIDSINSILSGNFGFFDIENINSGFSFLSFWNSIIYNFDKNGVKPNMRLSFSSDIQKLSPFISALDYGLKTIINRIFNDINNDVKPDDEDAVLRQNLSGIIIFLSIVSLIKKRLSATEYKTLTPGDINLEYQNIVSSYSNTDKRILQHLSNNNILTNRGIDVQTFNKQVEKKQAELQRTLTPKELAELRHQNIIIIEKRIEAREEELGRSLTTQEMNDLRQAYINKPNIYAPIQVNDFDDMDGREYGNISSLIEMPSEKNDNDKESKEDNDKESKEDSDEYEDIDSEEDSDEYEDIDSDDEIVQGNGRYGSSRKPQQRKRQIKFNDSRNDFMVGQGITYNVNPDEADFMEYLKEQEDSRKKKYKKGAFKRN